MRVTKQAEFGQFDIACKWQGKHRQRVIKEPWYILANLGSLSTAIKAYKKRSGIVREALPQASYV